MNIFESMGNKIQMKFDEINNIFLSLNYDKKASLLLSNFVLENNIELDKKKLLENKNDVEKLIYIVIGLDNSKGYIEINDYDNALSSIYHYEPCKFLLDSVLNKYSTIKDEINNYYEYYFNMLMFRIKE